MDSNALILAIVCILGIVAIVAIVFGCGVRLRLSPKGVRLETEKGDVRQG